MRQDDHPAFPKVSGCHHDPAVIRAEQREGRAAEDQQCGHRELSLVIEESDCVRTILKDCLEIFPPCLLVQPLVCADHRHARSCHVRWKNPGAEESEGVFRLLLTHGRHNKAQLAHCSCPTWPRVCCPEQPSPPHALLVDHTTPSMTNLLNGAQVSLVEEKENPGQDLWLSQKYVHINVHRLSADY